MTPEEKREYDKKQEQRKLSEKKRIRKCRQRVKLFIYVVLLVVFGRYLYLMGKNAALKEVREGIMVSVKEDEIRITEEVVVQEESEDDTADEKEKILLVNKNNPLPEDYSVELITMPDRVNRAAKEAYEPLCDMLTAGRKEGLSFEICSSYRDVERQKELFEEDVAVLMQSGYSYTEAYEEVAKETMPPGCSEHSTGLAFDIVALNYQILDEKQEKTAENIWLQEHCAEYGFILRYPKGKEDITSISYESWHFRYVGKEAAEYIMENGITLEEYLDVHTF